MARRSARTMWAEKLAGKTVESHVSMPLVGREPYQGIVLGVDPSLRGSGLAVLDFDGKGEAAVLHCATLKIGRKHEMARCLAMIHEEITRLLVRFEVRHAALEQTIYVQNFQTAQILGAARGAAIAAIAVRDVAVFEYPPLRIKQAVVGFGRASKEQMMRQVQGLLGLREAMASDEADACGAALCHAYTWRL